MTRAQVFEHQGVRHFVVARPERAEISPVDLTVAQRAVLVLLGQGLSNKEIAQRRRTSPRTVANQVVSLLRALGCESRTELGVYGRRLAVGMLR